MAFELLEIGVKMRKGAIFTIRGSFGSVCNHPFLVGFVCFLILLYRSSPFIFSLLVSASPVLICTAVLLGVLLSYGETNIPEIEIEEKKTTLIEKNKRYFVDRFSEEREGVSDDDATPLIGERSPEFEQNGSKIWQENGHSSEELKIEEVLESDSEKSEAVSFDSEEVNVDSLDSPPRSPWKRIQDRKEEGGEEKEEIYEHEKEKKEDDDERAESSDSESDWAESSSPDASMTDIMPMLDELHPLLDEDDNLRPIQALSCSGSDMESSEKSSTKSHDSDDESEIKEEDAQGENEGGESSAITWTEEDQKNLMDLGCLEIERNQRLENLILKRLARKSMATAREMNLIDLEGGVDYPFGLTPISTRRQNPFDLPYDDSGLPPIPGSAPSVLGQRRNPFDIPYGPNEEKPDLMEDGFMEEFSAFHLREAVFRRDESFKVGPSVRDTRMRPYFVPEGTILEDPACPSFRRQSSELSESKVSTVPETESVVSVEDLEDGKLSDEDSNGKEMEEALEGLLGDQEPISHQEEEKEDGEEENLELELMSKIENVSEHVGHGSESSDDEESSEFDLIEKIDLEIQLQDAAHNFLAESVTVPVTEYNSNCEGVERVYRRESSSSSLSEVSERVFADIEGGEVLPVLDERRYGVAEEAGISAQASIGSTYLSPLFVDFPQRDPIYDLSPQPIDHELSASLISSVGRESEEGSRDIAMGICTNGPPEVRGPPSEGLMRDEHGIVNEERETVRSQDSNAYIRADEKLISMPVSEGILHSFDDVREMHKPYFNHLDEVQESSVLVELSEDVQITQNMDMSDVRKPDQDTPSSNTSKSGPVFSPILSTAIETADSHVNLQTIDINLAFKETITSKEPYERELVVQETLFNEEIESFPNKAELDPMENKITYQGQVDTETMFQKIEDIDQEINEFTTKEPPKAEPVFQESLTDGKIEFFSNRAELASVKNEITYQDQVDTETTTTETFVLKASKIEDIDLFLKDISDTMEPPKDEKIDSFSNKAELSSVENETTYQSIGTETVPQMVKPEASKIEDINVAIEDITSKESPKAEQVSKETTLPKHLKNDALNENSSDMGSTHETLAVEVRRVEKDVTLFSSQSLSDAVDCARETSSAVHVAKIVLSKGTTSHPLSDEMLNGKSL